MVAFASEAAFGFKEICALVTLCANALLRRQHNRAGVIVREGVEELAAFV